MGGRYIIHHQPEPPAYYDIILDRGDILVAFRIAQFDMMALKDGTEVSAELVRADEKSGTPLDRPVPCDSGTVSVYDAGSFGIEMWGDPVIVLNVIGGIFAGTFHILKSKEIFSIRYIRSRTAKKTRG